MRPNSVPDRWLDYKPVGEKINGTPFIAFKVPLNNRINNNVPVNERFAIDDLIEKIPKLALIIDLTNTDRYYTKHDVLKKNIFYKKIYCEGHVIPGHHNLIRFFNIVDSFMKQAKPDDLIGVHCTHGLNRTGYFICRYMIQRLGISPEIALSDFSKARGYEIERLNYVNDLKGKLKEIPPTDDTNIEKFSLELDDDLPNKNKRFQSWRPRDNIKSSSQPRHSGSRNFNNKYHQRNPNRNFTRRVHPYQPNPNASRTSDVDSKSCVGQNTALSDANDVSVRFSNNHNPWAKNQQNFNSHNDFQNFPKPNPDYSKNFPAISRNSNYFQSSKPVRQNFSSSIQRAPSSNEPSIRATECNDIQSRSNLNYPSNEPSTRATGCNDFQSISNFNYPSNEPSIRAIRCNDIKSISNFNYPSNEPPSRATGFNDIQSGSNFNYPNKRSTSYKFQPNNPNSKDYKPLPGNRSDFHSTSSHNNQYQSAQHIQNYQRKSNIDYGNKYNPKYAHNRVRNNSTDNDCGNAVQ